LRQQGASELNFKNKVLSVSGVNDSIIVTSSIDNTKAFNLKDLARFA